MIPADDRRRAPTSGGELAYTDDGDGPVVVLIHGFPQSSFVWRDLGPLLSSRFRVIVPDMLGSGDSDKPEHDSRSGSSRRPATSASCWMVSEIERYAVIGHSVGGGVAQLLALDHHGVDAMVLMSSTAFDAWPTLLTREIQRTPPDQGSSSSCTRGSAPPSAWGWPIPIASRRSR